MQVEDLVAHVFICWHCLHNYHDRCQNKTACKYCGETCECLVCVRIAEAQKEPVS